MDDVRGDFLRPPHGTTPAAVIANKIIRFDPLEAVKHSKGCVTHYTPLLYTKMGYDGVYLFFLFLLQNIDLGTR